MNFFQTFPLNISNMFSLKKLNKKKRKKKEREKTKNKDIERGERLSSLSCLKFCNRNFEHCVHPTIFLFGVELGFKVKS